MNPTSDDDLVVRTVRKLVQRTESRVRVCAELGVIKDVVVVQLDLAIERSTQYLI